MFEILKKYFLDKKKLLKLLLKVTTVTTEHQKWPKIGQQKCIPQSLTSSTGAKRPSFLRLGELKCFRLIGNQANFTPF